LLTATQAAAIAASVMVHREMASAEAMGVHRHAVTPMHASTVKTGGMKSPMETATAAMETTTAAMETATASTMKAAPTAPTTVSDGCSAQRDGNRAHHRNKCNWPHDVSSQF
jgi:hypothetical protein